MNRDFLSFLFEFPANANRKFLCIRFQEGVRYQRALSD